jgi:adenine-specific DNA-methyltransferase
VHDPEDEGERRVTSSGPADRRSLGLGDDEGQGGDEDRYCGDRQPNPTLRSPPQRHRQHPRRWIQAQRRVTASFYNRCVPSRPSTPKPKGRASGNEQVSTPSAPPRDLNLSILEGLSHEELIALVEHAVGGGISVTFSGKANATRIARKVRPRVVRRIKALSVGDAESQAANLLIEGDNLQAMATLYRERGQVDLILTDPPYNTGRDFRYNDRWEEDPNDSGMGDFVNPDDGARHTKWMRFMWPRLQMMRSMLRPGGVLAICIDHRELFRLGQMLDELFGEQNRLAIINWQKMAGSKNHDTGVSTATEYVLVYSKDADKATTGKTERSEETAQSYRNPDNDPLGAWAPSDSTLMGASTHPGQVYAIQNPFTGRLHYPQEGRCWRNERAKMKSAVEAWGVEYVDFDLGDRLHPALVIKGVKDPRTASPESDPVIKASRATALKRRKQNAWPRFFWRADRQGRPGEGELRYKTYVEEVKAGVVPTTFWAADDFDRLELGAISWEHDKSGTTDTGLKELNAVVGRGHGFDTVKPLMLFEKIIQLWSPPDGLVMDPFAGSGTTGHAVLDLNVAAGSSRRFILIEQGRPERGDPYASSLTANRLKRVITGDWASGEQTPLAGGFSFLRLDKRVDAQTLLDMERDELVDTVIASHFDANHKRGSNLIRVNGREWRHLVAKNSDDEGFFLIWGGPDGNTDFSASIYDECATEAEEAGLKPYYHVYARLYLYQTENVRFYQIPDRILADFGLDMSSEPFAEPS